MFRSQARTIALSFALCAGAVAQHASAETMFAISGLAEGETLVRFDSNTPSALTSIGALTGVTAGDAIRAIDFRPARGTLYALGHNVVAGTAQLYTVDLGTAALTPAGARFALVFAQSRISIDFNPTVDRLRIVTSSGINLRVNPDTGVIAGSDSMLQYDAGDPEAGTTPYAADIAYTNNVPGATATTLYGYDYTTDNLFTIGGLNGTPSPNGGLSFTVGASGTVAESGGIGFDISGVSGLGFISIAAVGQTFERLTQVNLSTGALTLIGSFGATRILDISASPALIFANGFE